MNYHLSSIARTWLLTLLFAICQTVIAADYYVSPTGSDGNSGTQGSPFATIQRARDVVRAQTSGGMSENITVHLGAGNYFIEQSVVFDDRDTGKNGHTITYQGSPNLQTRIYGGRRITGWTRLNDTEYAVTVPDLQQHYTLYENDEAANGGLYHVFNDAPEGDWRKNGTQLVYHPRNLPIADQVVVLGTTKDVFVIKGRTNQQIVSNLVFDGLHMIGSGYSGTPPEGVTNFENWTGTYDGVQIVDKPLGVIFPEARHGQFFIENAQNIVIQNSKLYGAGFMAVFVHRWAQNNRIENCWIENAGCSGLYFQGWECGRGASEGITTLEASYCNKFNVIRNNVFHDIGRFQHDAGGVFLCWSGDNLVEHNVFNGITRYGVSMKGWRPLMINILYHYVFHPVADGILFPYAQSNITYYDGYIVTQQNQGAELNHSRNNIVRYNDLSQIARAGDDMGMIEQWGAGINNLWAYNACHDGVNVAGWDNSWMNTLYVDDGGHKPTLLGNVMYWIAGGGMSGAICSKGNFQVNSGNIIADCELNWPTAIGPFCEENTRVNLSGNIVASQIGMTFNGGYGTQTPIEAVKANYIICEITDTNEQNYIDICWPNGNVAYPIIQSAGNNVYFYQTLDRSDSFPDQAANLEGQVANRQDIDQNSVYADPQFDRQNPWWDSHYTDYKLKSTSPALAKGFQESDLTRIGLQAGFPFNLTEILGQSVSEIRLAADYGRLLKVRVSGSQICSRDDAPLPANSWARYNEMDFGAGQYEQFQIRLDWVANTENEGTAIEIRLDAPDGQLIGTLPYGQTSCRITPTTGQHDIFLVFPGENIQSLDWFVFEPRVIWNGQGSDNNWSTAANWSRPAAVGEALYFATSSQTSPANDFPAATVFSGLTFQADAPAYSLSGNAIALNGDLINHSTQDQVISLPLILPSSGMIQINTGERLMTLAGEVSSNGAGILKTGTGTLSLGAFNYSGDTSIESGRLRFTQPGFSRSSKVTIGAISGANAVLDLSHGVTEKVLGLVIDGVSMQDGSYGSSASAATYKNDTAFAGTGMIVVQSGPVPPTYSIRADGRTLVTFDFEGTGTWKIPNGVTELEVLVVGGGGGSRDTAFNSGNGGGGMFYHASYVVTPGTPTTIKVGAGAIDGAGDSSRFGNLIAYGGTKGIGYTDGGDQGGYSVNGGTTIIPGNPGMHYRPMDGNFSSGGGAGHAGYKGDTQLGGAGAPNAITGSIVYYAGGGGAPSSYVSSNGTGYNLGGGGAGPVAFGDRAFSGIPNSGGAGGGGWGGGGGVGGSGIVIVAYQSSSGSSYIVTFDSNGGSSISPQTVVEGIPATEPDNPIKSGHSFSGWYSDIELTMPYNFSTPITSNKTLYAKWVIANNFTLTYTPGANGSIQGATSQIITAGGSGTAVTAVPNSGYRFVQWSDNSTLNPRTDANVLSNITVTASFEQLPPGSIIPTSIVTLGEKTIATFSSGSGSWAIPAGISSVEVLLVGGGGSGAAGTTWNADGGGGGGLTYYTSYAVVGGSPVSITVGAGGAARTSYGNGHDGGASSFGSLTAGGGQGGTNVRGGNSGGRNLNGTIHAGGLGATHDGSNGGGGVGQNGSGDFGDSPGGNGYQIDITGTLTYYAGGGGGGFSGGNNSGGMGGGGKGADEDAGFGYAGVDGLGGGGGASRDNPNSGAGGSGVVIVAYQASTDPYDVWAGSAGYNLTSGRNGDDDGDGMSNFQEFAFGLDPTSSASINPISNINTLRSAGTFRYTRPQGSDSSKYTIWTSTNLQNWTRSVSASQVAGAVVNGVETMEVEFSPMPTDNSLFIRVQME